jgi:hypothetical protein
MVLGVGLRSVFFSGLDFFLLCNPVKCNNYRNGLCQYNYNLLFVPVADSIFTHGLRCAHVTPVRCLNLPGRFFVQMNALSRQNGIVNKIRLLLHKLVCIISVGTYTINSSTGFSIHVWEVTGYFEKYTSAMSD